MDDYCDNPLCEHKAARTVLVSVCWPGDETRRYCLPCHDAYMVGVQHGRLTENPDGPWLRVRRGPCPTAEADED